MDNKIINLYNYKLKTKKMNFLENDLVDRGFSDIQRHCILKYYEKGYDISKFITPDFSIDQIEIIGIGLETDVDVSFYSDVKYSAAQMEDIFDGLMEKVDVSIYANPNYSSELMQVMLSGLEAGLDVSRYPETYPLYEYNGSMFDGIGIEYIHDNLKNRLQTIPFLKVY